MKKKVLVIVLATTLALSLGLAPAALAWQEDCCPYYYINASYGGYYYTAPLEIKLNGDPSGGQTFYVGDTVTITGAIHSYAGMCGWENEAYTEYALEVSGPSGSDSDTAWDWVYSEVDCAEVETITTPTITYTLTAPGTHTVYMSSYAAVAYAESDVADEYVDASLTFEVVPAVIEVDIDIKPGSDPNSINLKSKGVVPVAVLTTDDFDASTIDPEKTVLFAGASPVRWTMEDVDDDGDLDMLFHFKTQELNLTETSTEATLTAYTYDPLNRLIEGKDTVNIVPKGKGK